MTDAARPAWTQPWLARPRMYVITDRRLVSGQLAAHLDDLLSAVPTHLPMGTVAVQLREKDLAARPLLALARTLRQVVERHRCTLFINERLDVALAAQAHGVHLPERGLDIASARQVVGGRLAIAISTHSPQSVHAAHAAGADFAVLGPIFATPSKARFGPPLGPQALQHARDMTPGAHVLALGGITGACAGEAIAAGAHGIAGIRLFMARQRPAALMAALCQQLL